MEGTPYIPEYNNDDPERREKRVPKAETIGSLAFEANPEKDPDKRQHSHERLGKTLINKETLQDRTEVNYEQDPVARHAQNAGAISRASGWIGSLLSSKSDLDLGNDKPATDTKSRTTPVQSSGSQSTRSIADIAMISVIALLLLLIILVIIFKQ